jgi:hypothetical protein
MSRKQPVAPEVNPMLNLTLFMFALLAVLEILKVTGVLLVDQSFLLGFGTAIISVFFESVRLQVIHNKKGD